MMKLDAVIIIEATTDEDPNFGYRPKLITALKEVFTDVVSLAQVLNNPELGKKVLGALVRPGYGDYIQNERAADLFPNLKCVVNYGVGVDHLKVDYLRSKGIKIGNTPGVVADATADIALLLMLASARNFPHGKFSLYHHYKHRRFFNLLLASNSTCNI